jgi:phospho-N-acetylmuramoyl-pentapeptide-transferase
MLYHLFTYLEKTTHFPGGRLFQYVTFRAGLAIILSLIISIVFGKYIVGYLRKSQVGESVRDLGLLGQKEKEGTPTMGGIIIILAIVVPCLLFAKLNNVYIILMLISTIWMGIIGFVDDYIKVFKKDKKGLHGIFKVLGQLGLGLIISITMLNSDDVLVRMDTETAELNGYKVLKTITTQDPRNQGELKEMVYVKAPLTNVPFVKGNELDYGRIVSIFFDNKERFLWVIFVPIILLIVAAVSNAANLTDGIDGLATGVSAIIGATLGVFAYVSGNTVFADYLNILYLPNVSELVIFAACFFGACIGFLWYNAYPAQVFMGDTGSLTLGGIIAALAILTRKELLIPVLCGIFVVENLSVMLQVAYFKYQKRKNGLEYAKANRLFLMSPLHHHYQKIGIHESKIVTRFWIIGIFLAVFTIITLKIR